MVQEAPGRVFYFGLVVLGVAALLSLWFFRLYRFEVPFGQFDGGTHPDPTIAALDRVGCCAVAATQYIR